VKVDLNFPLFQKDLFSLNKNELAAFFRTAKKLVKMNLTQILQSSGLNLEKIRAMKSPADKPLYSIRVTRSFRAVLTIDNDYFRFVSLHPDHDSAYR